MKSTWNNNIYFKIFTVCVWLAFLIILNVLVFSSIIWSKLWSNIIIVFAILWILLFYLLKYFKYSYRISENELIINTPRKIYRIPFKDIKKISENYKIPLVYKFWINFNHNENILYLCGFADKWIRIKLETHDIVISPFKYNELVKILKEI